MKVVASHTAPFFKVPKNIGDWLNRDSEKRAWKVFRLYVQYLDMKVQDPDSGTFQIQHSHRYYQRVIKKLIARGWAIRTGRIIHLRKYQHVWRDMGITRIRDKGILKFTYWKFDVSTFSLDRKKYMKEIEHEIRERITNRKLAQTRYALRDMDKTSATYSAKSAGSLFGYRSPYSGSKLRKKYFEILPMSEEEAKPRWNNKNRRYEEPTKQIAL